MSTKYNYEQNGRQPPLPNQPPPSDPRAGNVPDQTPVCRKYVWGTCLKAAHCKFRHEFDLEEMKKILKFCHDFQNKQGCTREDCTYLHASREEQNLFLETGQVPRVLAERYAAMSETNQIQSFKGIPQMMMFAPPPPPPPPTPMLGAAAMPPPPPPPQPQPMQPTFPVMHHPPPPPPPPTIPSTTPIQTAPLYTCAPPPQNAPVIFPLNQPPPPLPPMFDATKPPPPIPAQLKNDGLKRSMDSEAGPSKVRKLEGSKVAETCENCFQLELRADVYRKEMDKVVCELKYKQLMHQKRLKEFQSAKEKLRSLVSPEQYRMLDEYIEGGPPQIQEILSQINQNPVVSLLEYLLSSSRNVDSTLSPSLHLEDSFREFSYLLNPVSRIGNNSSAGLLHTILEALRNSNNDRDTRVTNGQNVGGSPPIPGTSSNRYTVPSSSTIRSFVAPTASQGSSTAALLTASQGSSSAPPPTPTPVTVYPPYHPGVPPPPATHRSYYAAPPSTPHTNVTYNTPITRGSMPVPPQMAAPPATMTAPPATVAPSLPPNFNQYMMGRYPHPPQYYPPFQ